MCRLLPILLAVFLGLPGCFRAAEPRVEVGLDQKVGTESKLKPLDDLARRFGIRIVTQPEFPVKTYHGPLTGKPPKTEDLESYVPILVQEFGIYPVELVGKTKLRRVILCRELAYAGQLRTGIPDYEHDDFYIDVTRGRHSDQYTRNAIHHEFFHIVDYKDDGEVYRDERWSKLNPEKFAYGKGGVAMQDDSLAGELTDRVPGFLNKYATSGVEEDKAEIFAALIIRPQYVSQRAKSEAVLKAKVERMRELVKDFCPQANEKFWDEAAKVKRDFDK